MNDLATAPEEVLVTILMPCLDEARTLAACIEKAKLGLAVLGSVGEIVVADNGSTDGSQEIAERLGARVVRVPARGYGHALRHGVAAARGRYVVMGDADDSYDFTAVPAFVAKLDEGHDLVVGNRFRGGIAAGAMPALHRLFGNPFLTLVGRRFFLREAWRVARKGVFVTTPNRWFPVEFLTLLPLVQWMPPAAFRALLRRTGRAFFASPDNLNLLSRAALKRVAREAGITVPRIATVSLAFWPTNLLLFAAK